MAAGEAPAASGRQFWNLHLTFSTATVRMPPMTISCRERLPQSQAPRLRGPGQGSCGAHKSARRATFVGTTTLPRNRPAPAPPPQCECGAHKLAQRATFVGTTSRRRGEAVSTGPRPGDCGAHRLAQRATFVDTTSCGRGGFVCRAALDSLDVVPTNRHGVPLRWFSQCMSGGRSAR